MHLNNGKAEGINNKIKVLKSEVHGFRDQACLKLKLYILPKNQNNHLNLVIEIRNEYGKSNISKLVYFNELFEHPSDSKEKGNKIIIFR